LHGAPGIAENDGMVHVSLAGGADSAAAGAGRGSPVKGRSAALSGAGLAGSPHASPGRARGKLAAAAGAAADGPDKVFGNPLAHIGEDVEVGPRLAPLLPHMKADKALQRAAIGGNKVSESVLQPETSRSMHA
jgi:hypothetical protein